MDTNTLESVFSVKKWAIINLKFYFEFVSSPHQKPSNTLMLILRLQACVTKLGNKSQTLFTTKKNISNFIDKRKEAISWVEMALAHNRSIATGDHTKRGEKDHHHI